MPTPSRQPPATPATEPAGAAAATPASRPGRSPRGLLAAFEAWLTEQQQRGRLRHASSAAVYTAMWQALVAWCLAQKPPVGLRHLDGATLARYIASRDGMGAAPAGPPARHGPLTARYQWRLLSLVQRVQAHHAMRQQLPPHSGAADLIAARPAVRRANASLADEMPAHLRPADAQALEAWLLASLQPAIADGLTWQDWRNRAAAGLQLGAGLGPGELRALQLTDVHSLASRQPALPVRVSVPANGSAAAHEVPLTPLASQLLAQWLVQREAGAVAGHWLFPSTRSGKPWGKVAQFQSVKRLLAEAGIADGPGGSFRLRHTFALRQLQRGHSPDEVARWLGIADPAVMARYQRVLAEPVTGD